MGKSGGERMDDLGQRIERELAMGGEKRIQKQHDAGKLTARERLELFFDPETFRELGMFVRHRCSDFDMADTFIPGDGVVTGHGTVDGRAVFAFSQDFTTIGGTLG
ncbi:unnamed protein product, partial [marine sediment metagenome]